MTPLNRAVALAEVDDVAMTVCEHLHLDVARVLEIPLDVHGGVREVRLALAHGYLERPLDLLGRQGDAQSLATAPGRRLDRDRVADLVRRHEDVGALVAEDVVPGNDGDAGVAHPLTRRDLRPHRLDRVCGRPDPHEPRRLDVAGEGRILGEEPYPGWIASAPARRAASMIRSPRRYD